MILCSIFPNVIIDERICNWSVPDKIQTMKNFPSENESTGEFQEMKILCDLRSLSISLPGSPKTAIRK